MPVSHPALHAEVQDKVWKLVKDLQSQVSSYHVDGKVSVAGLLRNGLGAKILISNLDNTQEAEIKCWQLAALSTGAVVAKYETNFQAGEIMFDVEYKRPAASCNYLEWLKYPTAMAILWIVLSRLSN